MDLIKQSFYLRKGISKILKELCLACSGKIIIILAENHYRRLISDDYEELQAYKPAGTDYYIALFRDVHLEK